MGVVSSKIIRIALIYTALNGLDVVVSATRSAYLHEHSSHKDYIVCGLEFGLEKNCKKKLIRMELYGGKAAGRNFRNHLSECMCHLICFHALQIPMFR